MIAATTFDATVDELDIEPVMVGVEMGFELGLAVVEFESEPKVAEVDDEADAKIQPKGSWSLLCDGGRFGYGLLYLQQ
nr:hypothetical protein [Tanacetum cinerariifolium]